MSSSMKHKISTSGVFVGLGLSALPLELASVVSIAATCPTDACMPHHITKQMFWVLVAACWPSRTPGPGSRGVQESVDQWEKLNA
eukprot:1143056-Pelagomonas_calceolata.AAC.4